MSELVIKCDVGGRSARIVVVHSSDMCLLSSGPRLHRERDTGGTGQGHRHVLYWHRGASVWYE